MESIQADDSVIDNENIDRSVEQEGPVTKTEGVPTELQPNGDGAFLKDIRESSDHPDDSELQIRREPLLWCHVAHRSHAYLSEWGIYECSSCHQDLTPPKEVLHPPQSSTDVTESVNKAGSAATLPLENDTSKASNDTIKYSGCRCDECITRLFEDLIKNRKESKAVESESEPADPEPNPKPTDAVASVIRYRLKFLDQGGCFVGYQPWDAPFDLTNARKDVVDLSEPVVEHITVLRTTIKTDRYRTENEREMLMEAGILKDPKYVIWVEAEEIVIRSQPILRTLKKFVQYYPGAKMTGKSMLIQKPYGFLFHHLESLQGYQQTYSPGKSEEPGRPGGDITDIDQCDQQTFDHLAVLLDILESSLGEAVREEKARYLQTPALATFNLLWLLFKPGQDVYTKIHGSLTGCVVHSIEFCPPASHRSSANYRIDMWYLDYDGTKLGRRSVTRSVLAFDGEKSILDLEVFPSDFLDREDQGKLRLKLQNRGRKYLQYVTGKQAHYIGEALGSQARYYEGRVIIDPATYYKYGTGEWSRPEIGQINDSLIFGGYRSAEHDEDDTDLAKMSSTALGFRVESPWTEYDDIGPKGTNLAVDGESESSQLNQHLWFLCPKHVIGFILKSRVWAQLDIELCTDTKFNKIAIDNLVMPSDRKDLINALVYRFTSPEAIRGGVPSPWNADFIQNKGEGQIFLLHGKPGVGKTYTAECIAESTGRPLLSLTCSDIGIRETTAEENLSKWFRLAEIWGAVLLLDEADVFLERRAVHDLKRNSLVSVFLRTMEYYRGIMFLTSNRVGHFDDAFVSRIHVVIKYDSLNEENRSRIWTQFLDKLEDERGDKLEIPRGTRRFLLDDPAIRNVAWNGREIRNMVQTAVALAEHRFAKSGERGPEDMACLKREDFEKVCEMAGTFKQYLDSFGWGDEQSRAWRSGERNDAYEPNANKTASGKA